jgi:hypothetical protein
MELIHRCLFHPNTLNNNDKKLQLKALQSYKPYTLVGFEPPIYCSVGRDDDHYIHTSIYVGPCRQG